jgi:4-amino-4-deoxy-L-arabinose transferase-like glycosyltransferase
LPGKSGGNKLLLIIVIILLVTFVIGSISLIYPFGRDQGIYAYAGKMLLEGKINYKYVFDLKPPGVHYTFAFAELFFGKSMLSIRIFDILWQAITAIFIFLILSRLTGNNILSVMFTLLYPFLYFRYDYWHTLQADGFLNLPFTLSILLLLFSQYKTVKSFVFFSGMLFGIVLLYKYTFILFLPFILYLFYIDKRNSLTKYKRMLQYSCGVCLILIVTFAIYTVSGSLGYMTDVMFVQIPLYARIGFETSSLDFILANLLRLFFGSVYSPLIIMSVGLLIYLITKNDLRFFEGALYIWLFSAIINLIIQWKFFLYHFLVIIPPLIIISAVSFNKIRIITENYKNIITYPVIILLSCLYIIFAGKSYKNNYYDLVQVVTGSKSLNQAYIDKGITTDSAFLISNTFKAIDYVTANTYQTDKIYIWGFDPLVYYLSGRHSSSRFIYNYPLFWKSNNEVFRNEFMEEIELNLPELILIAHNDALYYISGYPEDSWLILNHFSEFDNFIKRNYIFNTRIDNFSFYKLNKGQN